VRALDEGHLDLPEEFFEALHEGSRSTRIERRLGLAGGGQRRGVQLQQHGVVGHFHAMGVRAAG
jgi:hypothetical protein